MSISPRSTGMAAKRTATREGLTAHAILNSPREAKSNAGTARHNQNMLVKQELHGQMVRLRSAFTRVDPRLEGAIPRFQLPATLMAGGMALPPTQLNEAVRKYINGDGKFSWMAFCNDVEKARAQAWTEATRLKNAQLFNEIDTSGDGQIGPAELGVAVKRFNVHISGKELTDLFESMDEDGNGRLDLPEFVDGLATNMVLPHHVFNTVVTSHKLPYKQGGGKSLAQGATHGMMSPRSSPRGSCYKDEGGFY